MGMAKRIKARFFSHDSNARNDPKIIQVRMKYGMAGYGVYFAILEWLNDVDGHLGFLTDINTIAFELRVPASLVKSIVNDFGLFALTEDGKRFYSESFNRRKALFDSTSKSRSEKARKAAAARWGTARTISNSEKSGSGDAPSIQSDAPSIAPSIKKNAKENKIYSSPITARERACTCEEFGKMLMEDESFWQLSAMRFKVGEEKLKEMLEPFVQECACGGTDHHDYNDFRRHFFNWVRIAIEKENRHGIQFDNRAGGGTKADANVRAIHDYAARRKGYFEGMAGEEPDILSP